MGFCFEMFLVLCGFLLYWGSVWGKEEGEESGFWNWRGLVWSGVRLSHLVSLSLSLSLYLYLSSRGTIRVHLIY